MLSQARTVRSIFLVSLSSSNNRYLIALRILRVSEPGTPHSTEHKYSVGRDGYRIDLSRNLRSGSGLKIDSASTDVVWGHGSMFPVRYVKQSILKCV